MHGRSLLRRRSLSGTVLSAIVGCAAVFVLVACTPPTFNPPPAADPLTITPLAPQVAAGSQLSFTGYGGAKPYAYSVIPTTGAGTIDPSTGVYTAPSSPVAATIRVTDKASQTADTSITVTSGPLVLSPTYVASLLTGEHVQFQAGGGEPPYVYAVVSGVGSINGGSGDYSSPAPGAGIVVKVTDRNGTGNERTATIGEVKNPPTPPLTVSPSTLSVDVGSAYELTIGGGQSPYGFEVTQGVASPMSTSANPSTFTFTTPGIVKITASDSSDPVKTAVATITVNPPPLVIMPVTLSINVGSSWTFSADGGTGGYTYSIIPSGAGSVLGNVVTFTAVGPCTVRVTDSALTHADATITVNTAPAGLYIAPPSIALTRGSTQQFESHGGSGSGYEFSLYSGVGVGTIGSGGLFTASGEGIARIKLIDDDSHEAFADITVNPPPLLLDTASVTLEVGGSHQFAASGGTPPYTYSSVGVGTIGATTGLYLCSVPGTAIVRVTDSSAYPEPLTVSASVTVNPPPLGISPTGPSMMTGSSIAFTADGGTVGTGYVYSKVSGVGSINSTTGVYTSSSTGTATIQVRDNTTPTPLTASTTVTVTAPPLQITPTAAYVAFNGGQDFNATGGVTPYTFTVNTGGVGGTIDPATGVFTAPETAGTTVVRVTDSATPIPSTSEATITVYAPLVIAPKTASVVVETTRQFGASGGIPPYTFARVSGIGSITSGGTYTAPGTTGTAVVRVTDQIGNADQATVTVVSAWKDPVVVDSTGMPGQWASLDLGADGRPAIAYYGATAKVLKYAAWDGSWSVTTAVGTDESGKCASLAFDGADRPRISYYIAKGTKKNLGFAQNNGSWSTQEVDTPNDVGTYSSLALNPSDSERPRIAYYDATNDDLRYAFWNGSSWTKMAVDTGGDVGQYASLALDPSDGYRPRIAYYDATGGNLKYASWNGSAWVITAVDTGGDVGQYASLELDPSDGYRPRIAYYDATGGNLKYASWNGSAWVVTTVETVGDVGQYASLALDPSDGYRPRIAYYDTTGDDLEYASWNGSTWTMTTLDAGGDVGQYASLAISDTGKSKIAYYDASGKLKYVEQQ